MAAGKLEFLLVTSRKRRRWIIPKGTVSEMPPHTSAAREAYEEAGVLGLISQQCAGAYRRRKDDASGEKNLIVAYPLLVDTILPHWPEMALRKRQWVSAPEAVALIDDEGLKNLIATFARTYAIADPPI